MKSKNSDASAAAFKDKFAQAKAFIELEQYAKARAILKTIDHPTATKWLEKLDIIAPETADTTYLNNLPLAEPKKGQRRNRLLVGCLSLVVVCGVLYILIPPPSPAQATATAVAAAATKDAATAVGTQPAAATLGITPSATITETPLPSATSTATSTPAPEERIKAIANDVLNLVEVERVSVLEVGEPKLIAMDFPMFEGFGGYEVDYTARKMLDVVCALRDAGYGNYQIQLSGMVNLVNKATGQQSRDDGLTVRVASGTSAKWDCSNTIMMDAKLAVDDYILNPVFQ